MASVSKRWRMRGRILATLGADIDLATDQCAQEVLQASEIQKREADSPIDIRNQIDIALGAGLAARQGTEQAQPGHALVADVALVRAQDAQHLLALGERPGSEGRGRGGHGGEHGGMGGWRASRWGRDGEASDEDGDGSRRHQT
jgi:hypothetical protein